ncbi:cytochrome b5 [Mytilinidion resinicola]|uniref:Cytochrome b5 n=1 Tax=Mytilinidion resinicola TaxID=574789 RepID=A0A6A6YNU5_9PEZI|nr:cytochrome b5 [Mytilinidion resinicola]KAF2810253.1 cytochrome b5 [Mytilinidion resinicola]
MDSISTKNVAATFKVAPPEKDLATNDALSETFSADDVAKHSRPDDLWIIVGDEVFDVTKYQEEHPGGKKILAKAAGKDATEQFRKHHRDAILI